MQKILAERRDILKIFVKAKVWINFGQLSSGTSWRNMKFWKNSEENPRRNQNFIVQIVHNEVKKVDTERTIEVSFS